MNKNIITGLIIATLFGSGGIVSGFWTLKAKQEIAEKKIEKVEEKAEESENINIEQTTTLQYIQRAIQANTETLKEINKELKSK